MKRLAGPWQQKKRRRPYGQRSLLDRYRSEGQAAASRYADSTGGVELLERILEPGNMLRAHRRVRSNKGAPGVDRMTVGELGGYLRRHEAKVYEALRKGRYRPLPVRRVEIDKPDGGGTRNLGVPTVLDRLIQQAVAQEIGRIWEPTFSDSSFGFRHGRSQHDALERARIYVQEGYTFVVVFDLAKFFDRVNHDRAMSRLATRVRDKRVLKLIRSFLESGVMVGGLTEPTDEGVPQGGPLSPLLSNIVLDELDKELERRGLRFVRYADDIAIYVRSRRAGERVLRNVTRFVERRLKLKVNLDKSGVERSWNSKLLGYTFTNERPEPRLRLHWKTVKRLRGRIKELTNRSRGRSLRQVVSDVMGYVRGWWNYFGKIESVNRLRPIESWTRRRLRALIWKQWKNRRTRVRELIKRGIPRAEALPTGCAQKGPWRMSKAKWVLIALPNCTFEALGLYLPWTQPA